MIFAGVRLPSCGLAAGKESMHPDQPAFLLRYRASKAVVCLMRSMAKRDVTPLSGTASIRAR